MKQSNRIVLVGWVTKGNLPKQVMFESMPKWKAAKDLRKDSSRMRNQQVQQRAEVGKKAWVAGNEVEEEGRGQFKRSHAIQSRHLGLSSQSNEMLLENVKQKSDIKL